MQRNALRFLRVAGLGAALALTAAPAFAADKDKDTEKTAKIPDKAPPPAPYQKVSKLVPLPDFLPGLGTLYVDPATLPAGPFFAYDHDGKLVSTIYMIPLEDLNAHKAFTALKTDGRPVDHVELQFNAGHPGLEKPHYHVILWHVSPDKAAALAKQ
jgi:hypothetical protein